MLSPSLNLVNDGRKNMTSPPMAPEMVAEGEAKDRSSTLEEAPEHFARLRRWGLKFVVRFLVTSEAVEHERPYVRGRILILYRCLTSCLGGIYNREYLDYLRSLLPLLPNYEISAYVSLHKDVWSRYSG
ncbi:glycoside hydrolase family 5 protein [Laccaria bicolor S238N-H82]|uniref:Glycoside hydrolase family 5 protein n=1 Tax=Laccaria bicolor (strain S238N-H82 / ATCC MYA-4686) TaxID=486041 RepID=B0DMI8_LACBS|nr:glycoside hydrolase family 5 protein [Laccaria bicolor S238N-H82]EDR04298.1 glycoside hydrolase family 5 protein [Laccaria bicolor S238N-H82]|eukprot:XP_001885189.1 glycoside hydrolase family 5 protein [Laccaria bicolor S238N-H82]